MNTALQPTFCVLINGSADKPLESDEKTQTPHNRKQSCERHLQLTLVSDGCESGSHRFKLVKVLFPLFHNLPYPCPVDAQRCADLAIAHALLAHLQDALSQQCLIGIQLVA